MKNTMSKLTALTKDELDMVFGASCVCTKGANTVTTSNVIETRDDCLSFCCDFGNQSLEWELFSKSEGTWEKTGRGICTKKRSYFDYAVSVLEIFIINELFDQVSRSYLK